MRSCSCSRLEEVGVSDEDRSRGREIPHPRLPYRPLRSTVITAHPRKAHSGSRSEVPILAVSSIHTFFFRFTRRWPVLCSDFNVAASHSPALVTLPPSPAYFSFAALDLAVQHCYRWSCLPTPPILPPCLVASSHMLLQLYVPDRRGISLARGSLLFSHNTQHTRSILNRAFRYLA